MEKENKNTVDQNQETNQAQESTTESTPKKESFGSKLKRFGKEKVVPTVKLIGKGVAIGVSACGAALGTACLIGVAVGAASSKKASDDPDEDDEDDEADSKKKKSSEDDDDKDNQDRETTEE